jgi:hypothetical protein
MRRRLYRPASGMEARPSYQFPRANTRICMLSGFSRSVLRKNPRLAAFFGSMNRFIIGGNIQMDYI